MGEIVSEAEAQELAAAFRSNTNDAQKTELLVHVKQKVKHYGIENGAAESVFSALRMGMAQSSNITLFQHSLSCLGYLIKRTRSADPNLLRRLASDLLPLLLEKMGDAKDRIREMALTPVVDMWTVVPVETERYIREMGLVSKNSRLKESSLEWLARVHSLYVRDLSIKPYTSLLVRLLEDANDGVREKAKNVVVELFKSASDPAKADLKKSIVEAQVRKAIANYVIENITGPDMRASVKAEKEKGREEKVPRATIRDQYLNSITGVAMEEMKPAYINTARELENELNGMLTDLTGKETEGNWAARERHVTKIRELLRGNAPIDHPVVFANCIKTLSDGICNVVRSLRTTVATKGCQCVKDLFLVLGHGMDPTVDIILPTMQKLCGGTKKITAEAGHVGCLIIFAKVSYHHLKIPNYLYSGFIDKNIQPRLYSTGWFRALIEAHAHEKHVFEHGDGLKKLEEGLRKVLVDSNPGVRESARAAFWMYYELWPDRATAILEAQDANTQKLLQKDNPNGGNAGPSRPAPGRAATANARPSIKEQIAARRQAAAAQVPKLETAKSFPPPSSSVTSATTSATTATFPEKTGISSAPVRPGRPMRPKSQLSARIDDTKRPASSSSNGESVNAIEKTLERMNGGRAMSPSSSARSGFSPSTSSTFKKSTTTSPPSSVRQKALGVRHSPLGTQRKMTILEQLSHLDYRVRLEGIVVLGCSLNGQTPPNYEKRPPVPPADQLAPVLQKLVNDTNPEVVESVLAPEVLPEVVKLAGYDQVVPRVLLLLNDSDDHPRPTPHKSLALLKDELKGEAAELVFRIIQSMAATGIMAKKALPSGMSFSSIQKRRILEGALQWMHELVGTGDEIISNSFVDAPENFRVMCNRLIPMFGTAKPPNSILIAMLLKNMHKRNTLSFDRILATFDQSQQRELKKAWGMREEEDGAEPIEEPARVDQVLGIIPSVNEMPPPPRPNRGIIEAPDVTQKSDYFNQDEELTMINPMSALGSIGLGPKILPINPIQRQQTPPEQENIKPPVASPAPSVEIPDLLASSKKSNGIAAEKESIQVYQDPVTSILDFKTPKASEPLANITNSVRPRAKNFGASTTAGKTPEQQLQTLNNYMRKLKSGDIDPHGLRRMCAIVRDNPVKKDISQLQQQENADGPTAPPIDFWAGGQTFEEMLDALVEFLNERSSGGKSADELADARAQGVQLLRQLLTKATPFFAGQEHSVFPVLFKLRGEYPTQSPVSMNIDETMEEYVAHVADAGVGIPTIVSFLMMKGPAGGMAAGLVSPGGRGGVATTGGKKPQANVLALKTLADFIKTAEDEDLSGQWIGIGSVAKTMLEDEDPEVRRGVVNVCVELRRRIMKDPTVGSTDGDERLWKECLVGLSDVQRNLLTYYFARSR